MSITETLQLSFDYAALDDDTRLTVETHTDALKGFIKKTAGQIWEIGDRLLQVKAALAHGQFLGWLEIEFDWSYRSASRFMSVATKFKLDTVSNLNIAPTALYQLASDETPDEVRDFVLERAANGQTVKKAQVEDAIAAAKPKFQIGDWVSGIDFKNGGVVEGRIHSIGNKYLVLESGVNIPVGTAAVLEPYPQTEDSNRPDLALIPSPDDTSEGEDSSLDSQEEDLEETHGFKPGDIVAGFYNPTKQYEVGELESYSPSAYSLLVKADGQRCGVVTNTLRYPTEAEEDEYFAPAPAPANEPAAFIASRSGTDEHYTPDWVWKPALEVIEGQTFALDPASNSHHSPNVPAAMVYTIDDDGLAHDWTAADSIWINPPFSQMDEFVVKADLEAQGHLFFLAKCDCRPAWFSKLCDLCCSFVLIHKSVKFLGNENSSFFGVAIFYRGPDPDKFYRAYQHLGTVCMPVVPGLIGE